MALLLFVGALLIGGLALLAPLLWILAVPGFIAFFWVALAVAARRLHDRNKSAWWLLLFQGVPILLGGVQGAMQGAGSAGGGAVLSLLSLPISIWAFVELGCLRGTVGPNRFGDDPLMPVTEVFA